MRVLLCNYEYPPAGGGAGYATQNIARALARLGVSVDVLTSSIEDEEDGAIDEGVRVHRVPSWRRSLHECGLLGAYSYVAFAAAKRRALYRDRRYDIEHIFFSLPTGILALDPALRSPAPYVLSLRGSDVPGYDQFNPSLEKIHRLLLPLTRRIWGRAAGVVALSCALRSIAEEAVAGVDIDVIPNGIDIGKFFPLETATQRPCLKLLTVSRLLERKGIHDLLDAMHLGKRLPLSLKIIGTGPYEATLRARVAKLGLLDRVEFVGFVRNECLPAYYRAADVFVLPSHTESFGLVFAEAMASGLPVVATSVGGIPELVRSGVEGTLIQPGCARQLQDALAQMVADPARMREMGRAARIRIVERYTWEAIAQAYLAKYEDIHTARVRGAP